MSTYEPSANEPTSDDGSSRERRSDLATLRLGVSSCLLGQQVRYDGGHCRDRFLTQALGAYVEWVPVCPEVELGMGVPRPTIHLAESERGRRLVEPNSGQDHTSAMEAWAQAKLRALRSADLDGYVLKSKSPTCGMERVRVHGEHGSQKNGVGVFAKALMHAWPELPVEEEGRLNDPRLRESFVERVFARSHWRAAANQGWTRWRLVEFHTAHKLSLRAHAERGYRRLGRIVGNFGGELSDEELIAAYEREFHACMRKRASVSSHVNVLHHAMGYLKNLLDHEEKVQLLESIEDYREGILPLVVPLSLVAFQVRRHKIEYLLEQVYFSPHPKELMLRNYCQGA